MTNVIRYKRVKFGSVLTTITQFIKPDIEDQKKIINHWAKFVPKAFVIGEYEPIKADGVRHIHTRNTLNNLIATYAQSVPGLEGVILTNPNVELNPEGLREFAAYIEGQRMELMFGATQGKTIFMSSNLVTHLLNELPPNTFFHTSWQEWVDAWMRRILRQRYIDVSKYELAKPASKDIKLEPIPEPPPAPKVKKSTVRRVKVNSPLGI